MKIDSLAVSTPKFVLVPFVRALARNRLTMPVCDVEYPHSIWQTTVLVTEQDKVAIVRVEVNVIDPELFFAQYFFRLSRDGIHAHDRAGRFLKKMVVRELLSGIGAL